MSADALGTGLLFLGGLLLVAGMVTMAWALYAPGSSRSEADSALDPVIDLRRPMVVIDLRAEGDDQVWRAAIPARSSRREE
jgi:hypothetical protein